MSFLKDFLLRDVAIRLPQLANEVQFLLIASKSKNIDQPRFQWVRRAVVERWLRHVLTQPHYAAFLIDQTTAGWSSGCAGARHMCCGRRRPGDDAGPVLLVRHNIFVWRGILCVSRGYLQSG